MYNERALQNQREYRMTHKKQVNARQRERLHRLGLNHPMSEAKDCSQYLGIHIAERVLSGFFENITKMPMHNPGYDYVCGKGYKIDAKSSCLIQSHKTSKHWFFRINKNQVADYFLCLAFNNRESLEPQHVWLIPGNVLSNKIGVCISDSKRALSKWLVYEKSLERVFVCCEQIKGK